MPLGKTTIEKEKKIEESLPGHTVKILDDQGKVIEEIDQQRYQELKSKLNQLEEQRKAGQAKAVDAETENRHHTHVKAKDDKTNSDYTKEKDVLDKFKQSYGRQAISRFKIWANQIFIYRF